MRLPSWLSAALGVLRYWLTPGRPVPLDVHGWGVSPPPPEAEAREELADLLDAIVRDIKDQALLEELLDIPAEQSALVYRRENRQW